jgi:hypothetical protein
MPMASASEASSPRIHGPPGQGAKRPKRGRRTVHKKHEHPAARTASQRGSDPLQTGQRFTPFLPACPHTPCRSRDSNHPGSPCADAPAASGERRRLEAQVGHRHARHSASARAKPLFWSMAARFTGRIEGRWPVHCPECVCAGSPYPQASTSSQSSECHHPQVYSDQPYNRRRRPRPPWGTRQGRHGVTPPSKRRRLVYTRKAPGGRRRASP